MFFPYSERPHTPASKMPQVPVPERKTRAHILRELGQQKHNELLHQMIDKNLLVLVEKDNTGWTENYLHVIIKQKVSPGKIIPIQIKGVQGDTLVG